MNEHRFSRRTVVTTVGTGLSLGLGGCLGGADPGPGTVEMTDSLRYQPQHITVATGDTVTWVNAGSAGHTVTAYGDGIPDEAAYFASGGFDSEQQARENLTAGLLEGGEEYSHTFSVPGTYEYFCIPHENAGMTGTIRVE